MKHSSALLTALIVATPAHAGISDMINDYFTFREEQKPLIAPQQTLPPKHVISPSYNGHEAQKWNNYYTRDDLTAKQNFDSSSMVMRPRDKWEDTRFLEDANTRNTSPYQRALADSQNPQPLYDRMEELAYANRAQQQADGKIFIGEPGATPHDTPQGNGQVGAETRVGNPIHHWKDKLDGTNFATPRVGDYNYSKDTSFGDKPWQEAQRDELMKTPTQARRGEMPHGEHTTGGTPYGTPVSPSQNAYAASGNSAYGNGNRTAAGTSPYPSAGSTPSGSYLNAPMGYQQSLADKPRNYIVEPDDSLSGISGKERIYGDWKMWPLIYDANRNQIEDPDLIHPGQNLGIPRDYSGQQAQSARQRAQDKYAPYDFYDGQ